MIGFDRPLHPRWIYETLLLAQPGQRLSELNKPFENIARELTGKEGKRKARTVLFRCFLRDKNNSTRVREKLVLKDLSLQYGYEFMVPIFLFYLVGKTDILLKISEHLFRLYDYGSELNTSFLREKMIGLHGERDVVIRSTRSFLKTMANFGVIENSKKKWILKKKLPLNEVQFRILIQLYAWEVICSPQVSLDDLPQSIFAYFSVTDVLNIARRYSGQYWDYQQRVGANIINVY